MQRREFLKTAALTAATLAMNPALSSAQSSSAGAGNAARLPRRPYGKGGKIELSVIGLGGIVVSKVDPEHAQRTVAQAVERGVNYFDVAPTYGNAEEQLGPALEPYRKNCFLACKTTQRQREAAQAEFERSLQRLRTDYFDLYQLHALNDIAKDVDVAFAPGGVMELLIEARQDGRIRHLGFSAHSVTAALAAMDRFDFDSVLFPVNFATFYKGNFGPQVLEKMKEKGVSGLALKALARQAWPKDDPQRQQYKKCWYQPLTDPREAALGLRFTLSQPVTAAVPPGEESLFWLAVDLAMNFQPLTEAEAKELQALAGTLNPIFHA